MKKIIFLLMFPILSFSQINERQEKLNFRNNSGGSIGGSMSPQTFGTRPSIGEFEQKQIERERNRQIINNKPGSNRTVVIGDPYWNYWGWGGARWNAPWGWNTWSPFFWYDDWGYRNPGRVYVYDNGKKDTIKVSPLHGSVGVSYNLNGEIGGWASLGRELYFVGEYSVTNNKDISVFYPNLTFDKVIGWKDRKLPDFVESKTFSLGVGKNINKFMGIHAMVGFRNKVVRYKYFDEMYVLSNNGEYSFPNYQKRSNPIKVGSIFKFSNTFAVKVDYNLSEGDMSFGLGVKF